MLKCSSFQQSYPLLSHATYSFLQPLLQGSHCPITTMSLLLIFFLLLCKKVFHRHVPQITSLVITLHILLLSWPSPKPCNTYFWKFLRKPTWKLKFLLDLKFASWQVMDTFDTTNEKLYFNLLMSNIYDAHFPLKRLKKVFLGLTKTPIMKLPNVTSYINCFGQPVLIRSQWNKVTALLRVAKKDYLFHLMKCNSHPTIL